MPLWSPKYSSFSPRDHIRILIWHPHARFWFPFDVPNMRAGFSIYALMISLWSPLDTPCYYFRIFVNLSFSHTFTQHRIHNQTITFYCERNKRRYATYKRGGFSYLTLCLLWMAETSQFPVFIMTVFICCKLLAIIAPVSPQMHSR